EHESHKRAHQQIQNAEVRQLTGLPDRAEHLEQQNRSEHVRHGDKPTSEKHQKPLPHHPFLLFRLLPEQKGGSLSAAVLPSWSKTFQVPGQVQRSEPCQHSTAFSLQIAHYRPTSSVNGANAIKISTSAFASHVAMRDARHGRFVGIPRHSQGRPGNAGRSPQERTLSPCRRQFPYPLPTKSSDRTRHSWTRSTNSGGTRQLFDFGRYPPARFE